MKFKQYKISDMIKALQKELESEGDLSILLSCDEEGNSFSPIGEIQREIDGKKDTMSPFSIENDSLIIYPS